MKKLLRVCYLGFGLLIFLGSKVLVYAGLSPFGQRARAFSDPEVKLIRLD
jgi:hypothetical protein